IGFCFYDRLFLISWYFPVHFAGAKFLLSNEVAVEKALAYAYPFYRAIQIDRRASTDRMIIELAIFHISDLCILLFEIDGRLLLRSMIVPGKVDLFIGQEFLGSLHINLQVDHIIVGLHRVAMGNRLVTYTIADGKCE